MPASPSSIRWPSAQVMIYPILQCKLHHCAECTPAPGQAPARDQQGAQPAAQLFQRSLPPVMIPSGTQACKAGRCGKGFTSKQYGVYLYTDTGTAVYANTRGVYGAETPDNSSNSRYLGTVAAQFSEGVSLSVHLPTAFPFPNQACTPFSLPLPTGTTSITRRRRNGITLERALRRRKQVCERCDTLRNPKHRL